MQSAQLKLFINIAFISVVLLLFILCLSAGNTFISPIDSVLAIFEKSDFKNNFIINELRLPRVASAILIGSTLALSGLLIQLVARNKLANPEYLGITDGAIFALMVFIIVSAEQQLGPWWVAPIGAILTSITLLLITGRSEKSGYRFIILGIGVSALIRALNDLMLATTDLQHASAVFIWSLGSLNAIELSQLIPLSLIFVFCFVMLLIVYKKLPLLNFQSETAKSLGLNVNLLHFFLYFIALLLASFSVGVAGPIAFLALIAPIIASGILRPPVVPIMLSMSLGAIILLLADTGARTILPNEIPAGIMTTLVGGPLLLFIILRK